MMKKLIALIFAGSVLLSSCTDGPGRVKLINDTASLPPAFNFDKLGLKVMSSSMNKKRNTMSTLYANPVALQHAIKGLKEHVPGEIFALVTWKKQADDHWFGANIPGELQSIELVNTTSTAANYKNYEGKALTLNVDTTKQQQRISYILSQQPSVMP
jgi:hypothetical protein